MESQRKPDTGEEQPAPQPGLLAAVVLAVAGLAIRVVHVASLAELPSFRFPYRGLDADLYAGLARRIAAGDLVPDGLLHAAPLYAYWLACWEALTPGNPWAPRLAQALLGALAVFLAARAGAGVAGRTGGFLAGVFCAVNPLFVMFEGTLQSAALVPVLMTAVAHALTGRRPRFATGGLLAGLFVLLRPDALPMPALLAVVIAITHAPRQAVRFAVVALVPILPFTLVMSARAGGFVPVTAHGGIHLYVGNHENAQGYLTPPPGIAPSPAGFRADAKRIAERETGRALTPSEVSVYWSGRARAAIADDPARWSRLLATKARWFWNDYELPNNEDLYFLRARTRGLGPSLPVFGLLAPLALFALPFARIRPADKRVLGAMIAASFAGALLFFVTGRYRLPAHVPLILLAAAGAAPLLEAMLAPRVTRLAIFAALLAIVNVPVARFDESAPLARLADSHFRAGALDDAEALYREALAIAPGFIDAKTGLAAVLEAGGRADEAAALYAELARSVRAPAGARIRAAALRAEAGDLAGAEAMLATMLADDRNPGALAALAGIRMQQARDAEADALLREALDRDPEERTALLNAALLAARRGGTDRADSLLTTLLILDPAEPRALFNAGSIAARTGDLPRAIALWERLESVDPDYPRLREQLGRARELRGR